MPSLSRRLRPNLKVPQGILAYNGCVAALRGSTLRRDQQALRERSLIVHPLRDESVTSFHSGIFEALAWLGIAVRINPMPQEVPDPVPFNRDYTDCSYDPQYANRLLLETSRAGVFAAGDVRSARSSASPRPSAKAPWRFRSCMSTSSTCEEVNAPPGARRAAVWSAT
jgi:hypothetical protein